MNYVAGVLVPTYKTAGEGGWPNILALSTIVLTLLPVLFSKNLNAGASTIQNYPLLPVDYSKIFSLINRRLTKYKNINQPRKEGLCVLVQHHDHIN